jgi:hypothetical protein
MSKIKFNALVNICSFLSFSVSAISGFILRAFPPRSGRSGEMIWGIIKQDWHEIHYYTSLVFLASIAVHLLLHFPYIKNLPKLLFPKGGKQ